MSGYCGKFLRINLTAGTVKVEALDLDIAKKYIGGRGLGTYFMKAEVPADVDVSIKAKLSGFKTPTLKVKVK